MTEEEIKKEFYKVNPNKSQALRNAEMALRIVKGEKLGELAKEYLVSKTTVSSAYKKTCRTLYYTAYRFCQRFDNQIIADKYERLRECEFKSDEGIKELEDYVYYLKKFNEKNPEKKFLDLPIEFKSVQEIVLKEIGKLKESIECSRKQSIKHVNQRYDVLFNKVKEIEKILNG